MAIPDKTLIRTTARLSEQYRPYTEWGKLVMIVVIALLLVAPVWIVKYPPLIDYPNHLARAFIIAHIHDPQLNFSRFYGVKWNLYPYLAMDLILITLQQAVSIEVAGKILLSIASLCVPAAAWIFLREANQGGERLAAFTLLIPYNALFLDGVTNTYLSLALCFCFLALWLKYLKRCTWGGWIVLCSVTTTLYFTHLLGFGMAWLILTIYAVLSRLPLRQLLASWAIFLPGAVCYAVLRLSSPADWTHGVTFLGPVPKVLGLIDVIRGYSNPLDIITALALIATFAIICLRNPGLAWNCRWFGITAVLLGFYFVFPPVYGGGWDADKRLLPFVFIVALAVVQPGRRSRAALGVALILFLARVVNVSVNFMGEQPRLEALARSFAQVPRASRVLPIVDYRGDREIRKSYRFFWSYGVIDRGWLSPYMYEAKSVHALRVLYHPYSPAEFNFAAWGHKSPDFPRIAGNYDYILAYRVPQFDAGFRQIADLTYRDGEIAVYHVRSRAQEFR